MMANHETLPGVHDCFRSAILAITAAAQSRSTSMLQGAEQQERTTTVRRKPPWTGTPPRGNRQPGAESAQHSVGHPPTARVTDTGHARRRPSLRPLSRHPACAFASAVSAAAPARMPSRAAVARLTPLPVRRRAGQRPSPLAFTH